MLSQAVKNENTFSGQKLYWLGMFFVFLAVFSFAATWLTRKTPVPVFDPSTFKRTPFNMDDLSDLDDRTIFERLDFQKTQQDFQTSYLDLIQEMAKIDTSKIDTRKGKNLFKNYNRASSNYQEVKKKFSDYEKTFKVKCFARMRSLVFSVLSHDRKTKKRMTKFEVEKLIKSGFLEKMPECPRDGKYSIVYKTGKRLFHCSVHGILKN